MWLVRHFIISGYCPRMNKVGQQSEITLRCTKRSSRCSMSDCEDMEESNLPQQG